jgi:DNA-binding NarL/FixJ family response regulator
MRWGTIVADGDPYVRRVVRDALTPAGLPVIAEARTGLQAVDLALHHRPDFVLMDLVLPELDAIRATQRILAEDPDQRIVIFTEHELLGLAARRAGAAAFISKDLEIDALPRLLRALRPVSSRCA